MLEQHSQPNPQETRLDSGLILPVGVDAPPRQERSSVELIPRPRSGEPLTVSPDVSAMITWQPLDERDYGNERGAEHTGTAHHEASVALHGLGHVRRASRSDESRYMLDYSNQIARNMNLGNSLEQELPELPGRRTRRIRKHEELVLKQARATVTARSLADKQAWADKKLAGAEHKRHEREVARNGGVDHGPNPESRTLRRSANKRARNAYKAGQISSEHLDEALEHNSEILVPMRKKYDYAGQTHRARIDANDRYAEYGKTSKKLRKQLRKDINADRRKDKRLGNKLSRQQTRQDTYDYLKASGEVTSDKTKKRLKLSGEYAKAHAITGADRAKRALKDTPNRARLIKDYLGAAFDAWTYKSAQKTVDRRAARRASNLPPPPTTP